MHNSVLLPLLKRPRVISLMILFVLLSPFLARVSAGDGAIVFPIGTLLRLGRLADPLIFLLSFAVGLVLSLTTVDLQRARISAVVPRMRRGLRIETMAVMSGWALGVSALFVVTTLSESPFSTLFGMAGLGLAMGWLVADRTEPRSLRLLAWLALIATWLSPQALIPWLADRPRVLLPLAFGLLGLVLWRSSTIRMRKSSRPLTIHEVTLMTAYLDKPVGSWFWPERRFSVDGSATTSRGFRSAAAFEAIGMLRGGKIMLNLGLQIAVVLLFIGVPIVIAAMGQGAAGVSKLLAALSANTTYLFSLSLVFWWCWTIGLTDTPRLGRDRLIPISRKDRFHNAYSVALEMHLVLLVPGLVFLGAWALVLSRFGDVSWTSAIVAYSPGLLVASGLAPLAQWLSATGQSREPAMTMAKVSWWTLCAVVVYFSTGAAWCALFSSANLSAVLLAYGAVLIAGQLIFNIALRKHFATSDLPLRTH